jgi:hypothetical protein
MLGWEQPDFTQSHLFENRYKNYDQLIPYLKSKGVPYTFGYYTRRMRNGEQDFDIHVDLEAFIKSLPKDIMVVRPK